jgi:hypothetical protein
MATRCNIIGEDNTDRIQLYRHWDGYPEAVLPDLQKALPFAWNLPRFEATDFAAAIVRAWKEEGGGNIYIEGSAKGWAMINDSIEWIYLIKPERTAKPQSTLFPHVGEPVVEVYDWQTLNSAQTGRNKTKLVPVMCVKLSAIREAIPTL